MSNCVIAPSILSADFARLGDEVNAVLKAGADWVHFDVMDNHYVPNLTIGPLVCEALRKHGITAPIDVHLMVEPVDRIVPDFAKAGASVISFHPEASRHVDRTIQLIKSQGCQAGLVLNPATPVEVLDYTLENLDLVLVMSVNPGFGGQSFIDSALRKIEAIRKRIDSSGKPIRLEVDGGVKADYIGRIAAEEAREGQGGIARRFTEMRAAGQRGAGGQFDLEAHRGSFQRGSVARSTNRVAKHRPSPSHRAPRSARNRGEAVTRCVLGMGSILRESHFIRAICRAPAASRRTWDASWQITGSAFRPGKAPLDWPP